MRNDGTSSRALDREECLALLRSAPVGRVVYTDQALPAIQPVTFAVDGDETLVIRTMPGSKFETALRGAIVAFEIDDIDAAARTGWAVTAVGRARAVTDESEARHLARLLPRPWAPGAREAFIRITCRQVSGVRLASAHLFEIPSRSRALPGVS
ncbi:pyridoxamine 5'-phosphate oxidase family protein [Actinomadura litoris]|uniref:Pyridoxamine 5'-phosphate oxidase family protein n=1 Tax=Actinomadura litoris TaxID=2678616 RepID=A0A7K1L5F6_9ACTN|nr:pyridoxamine 5'-phosphate oxidase family protein [Actinomadura litoris]MUN39661.1 pyridoxamine 5'-phosphate oxidase family protein [Actinomadura litoris]